MLWSSVATAITAFGLPVTSFGRHYFEFGSLAGGIVGLTGGVLVAYFLSAEVAKQPFFRRLEL